MRLLVLIFVISVFLIFPLASAQPVVNSVSGTMQNGQGITISGSGFGNHPDFDVMGTDYLCSWWDNFDDYSAVAQMSSHYTCTIFEDGVIKPIIFFNRPELYTFFKNLGDQNFDLSSSINRGTSSIRKTPNTGSSKLRQASNPFNSGGVHYMSFWLYLPSDYYLSGVQQWKIIRMFGPSQVPGGSDLYPGIVAADGGPFSRQTRMLAESLLKETGEELKYIGIQMRMNYFTR